MDFEKAVIRYIVDHDLTEYYRVFALLKSHYFDVERDVYDFIADYVDNYKAVPSLKLVEDFAHKTYDNVPTEPIEFYIDVLRTRYYVRHTRAEINDLANLLESGDPERVIKRMEDYSFRVRKEMLGQERLQSIFANLADMEAYYEAVKTGSLVGVPTPWTSVNDIVLGFMPGDFVLFAARSGIGKTTMLLILADYCFTQKYKVLFITPEITQMRLLMRFASIHFKVPYDDLRRGRLSVLREKEFWDGLRTLSVEAKDTFLVMGKDMEVDLANIRAAIYEARPDIVFIDAIYLLRPIRFKVYDRTERLSAVADEIKLLALEVQKPIVTSIQFNRTVSARKGAEASVSLENIALSDQIGWNIDWGFALLQDDDMKSDGKMVIRPIKTREAYAADDILINWDFKTMNFSEVGYYTKGGLIKPISTAGYGVWGTPLSTGAESRMEIENDDDEIPF